MHTIVSEVRAFIADRFLLGSAEGLASEQSLLESGVLDSTGVMELVLFLEETYGVRVLDAELTPENLDSIDKIARFITAKRRAGAPTM